ncbi:MAG: sigma-70 family RNA polymerase sigma factor [Bacteroidota bacterium]
MQHVTEDKFVEAINSNIGIIHKICNVYFTDADDRKDICQEILYQLWRSYPAFKGDAKFSTWMYKVALNTAITYSKKAGREVPTDMQAGNWEQLAANNDPQHNYERMALLYAAINTLSVTDKAITLLYLEDNSYEEIAEITGITKTNVSVRLVRIKKALKEKLKNII